MENAVSVSGGELDEEVLVMGGAGFTYAHEKMKDVRNMSARLAATKNSSAALDLHKRSLLFDAPYDFDAFCRYIEFNREPKKQFYMPRRKQLLPMVKDLQGLADDKLDLLAISCPPGIGKTTLAIFALTWFGGKWPELPILGGSHSNSFLRGVYDEIQRIVTPGGEYLWNDVFPHSPLVKTNAKDMRLDLQTAKRFETFEFSSIGSGNAGKVRAGSLLYCDDLVDGIETALSRDRLDKLWQQYYTDLRQRKIGNCKELHIATRWSRHDVIGRLQEMYEGDPRAKFVAFSALNENDESNFDYPHGVGFTTEFYHKQREIMDDASWRALYMNEPIERYGLLYEPAELRRYFELPDREPDAIVSICDIADGGGDYWTMPIAYRYGSDYYIDKWVCDNGKPDIVEEKIVNTLLERKVELSRFESNRAGGRVAESVQKRVREKGGRTRITTKWNQQNKETRIIVASGFAKEHFLFKDDSVVENDKEYKRAMDFLTSYTMHGKNKHDDVPDAIAMLVDYIQNFEGNSVQILRRPW